MVSESKFNESEKEKHRTLTRTANKQKPKQEYCPSDCHQDDKTASPVHHSNSRLH